MDKDETTYSLTIAEKHIIRETNSHIPDFDFCVKSWKSACEAQGKRLCPVIHNINAIKMALDELASFPEIDLAWSLMGPKSDGTIQAPVSAQNILMGIANSDDLNAHLNLPDVQTNRRAKKILTELYVMCR